MSSTCEISNNMSFSQRNGYAPIPQPLQLEEFSDEIRNEFDAAIKEAIEKASPCFRHGETCYKALQVANWDRALREYWVRHLKFPYDQYNFHQCLEYNCITIVRFGPFNEVIDLLENLLNLVGNEQPSFSDTIIEILSIYQSPYVLRKISSNKWWFIQTGNNGEQEAVRSALAVSESAEYNFTRHHLEEAGHKLTQGDSVGSAEHSLKALEAHLRIIGGEPNKTGGAVLKDIKKLLGLPKPLFDMLEAMWVYRNDAPGVGHAMKTGQYPSPDKADAQFIYVACCGAISYLSNKNFTKNNRDKAITEIEQVTCDTSSEI